MSTKLTIKETVEVIPVSESSLRRDIKSGKVSSEKDLQGRRRIDASELTRVYGELKRSTKNRRSQMNLSETLKRTQMTHPRLSLYSRGRCRTWKAQLDSATEEKSELLKLLSAEKAEKRALMPPVDEKPQKSPNWLLRLVGAR